MLFQQTISKRININNSDLIIDANFKDKKCIPFAKINNVYISFEKLSVETKRQFLFIGFITALIIIVVFPYFLIFAVMTCLVAVCYTAIHFYKFCTLNVELSEQKVRVRFISLDVKYELVNIVQELRRRIQLSKVSTSVHSINQ
jgi:multisubunit Na+/H+ antiporter MnhE subunit